MPTLQTRPSAADCAVAGVLGAITATRQTNAPAKAKELIMISVNFVFIVIVSFCLVFVVLAFFDSHHGSYFWPFTEVQNGNHREVTTKCGNSFRPKETKAGKTLVGSLGVRDRLCSLRPIAKVQRQLASHTLDWISEHAPNDWRKIKLWCVVSVTRRETKSRHAVKRDG